VTQEIWHPLMPEADFPAEGKHVARINDWHVLVVKNDGGFFALNDRCSHQASHLSTGRIRRGTVMCPLHGARFEVASGRCVGGAYKDIRTFPVRLSDGVIEISVPAEAPALDELPLALS
jgi:anthranilate 1,2-dioxygenase ferredoxin component